MSFTGLQFDPEEQNIPDEIIISKKHFKILNSKTNSILQFFADIRSKHYVSEFEVDSLLKAQESRLHSLINDVNKRNNERILNHSCNLTSEVSNLSDVSNECHLLF